jgi:hypothetical protein
MSWDRAAACLLCAVSFACSDGDTRKIEDSGTADGQVSDSAIAHPADATLDATTMPSDASTPDATTLHDCTSASAWVEPPFSAVQVSTLEVLCARFNCASSIADAIARATQSCFESVVESGCGYTTVRDSWAVHHFDTTSNRLIGAGFGSDIFFDFEIEGCKAAFFQAGRAPDACATRTAVDLCDDAGADDAGR